MYIRTYAHVCMYIHLSTLRTYVCVCTYVRMYTCISMHVCTRMYVYTCIYVCSYVHVCTHIYLCTHVYTYIHCKQPLPQLILGVQNFPLYQYTLYNVSNVHDKFQSCTVRVQVATTICAIPRTNLVVSVNT